MRPLAIAATVLTCAAATAAGAQTSSPSVYPYNTPAAASRQALLGQLRGLQGSKDQISALALLNDAAFAPKTASSDVDPISRLIEREGYQPGAGIVRWMTGETQLSSSAAGGAIDSLRVSVGGEIGGLRGLPLNLANAQYSANAYEVALTRDWPAALAFDTKAFGVDLTPHAGVGVTNLGGSAEAGATLRLTQRDASVTQRLHDMGVKDGSTFGDRGRWYLFAAASGRAVGLNMLHGDNGWDRAGWTTDQTSTLIGDAQLGVGFRKGPMQTSLGYIHREVKGAHQLWGVENHDDSLVAFSLQIRPGK